MGSEGASINLEYTVDQLNHQLGLDIPVHIQSLKWIKNVFRGDLGNSLWTGKNITQEILATLPISMELGIIAIILGLVFSLPIAVFSAMRQETLGDYAGRTISILAISIPALWIGTMAMVYPSIWWHWTPAVEYIPLRKDVWGNLVQFVLPAAILGMGLAGSTMRMTRTMLLEVLRQDYIRTAWSKGLKEMAVVKRHALKNAFVPILTIIGNQLPILIGGSAILEQIFGLPGMGRYLITALNTRDYPIISAINLVMAGFVLFINIIIDILYVYLDPRIKYD
jgi:peptide/nickel transport system permease protein